MVGVVGSSPIAPTTIFLEDLRVLFRILGLEAGTNVFVAPRARLPDPSQPAWRSASPLKPRAAQFDGARPRSPRARRQNPRGTSRPDPCVAYTTNPRIPAVGDRSEFALPHPQAPATRDDRSGHPATARDGGRVPAIATDDRPAGISEPPATHREPRAPRQRRPPDGGPGLAAGVPDTSMRRQFDRGIIDARALREKGSPR